MHIIAKKTPKHFLNTCVFNLYETSAPIIAPIVPVPPTINPTFLSIVLFFQFIHIAAIDVGMKNIKFDSLCYMLFYISK